MAVAKETAKIAFAPRLDLFGERRDDQERCAQPYAPPLGGNGGGVAIGQLLQPVLRKFGDCCWHWIF
ncbi:MAG: hypothetical protein HC770_05740 [Pseudanabaena sp. CRU_2_10]|nr:hypothetical protein [Pseudanabaena sp. CRU_2_10]